MSCYTRKEFLLHIKMNENISCVFSKRLTGIKVVTFGSPAMASLGNVLEALDSVIQKPQGESPQSVVLSPRGNSITIIQFP